MAAATAHCGKQRRAGSPYGRQGRLKNNQEITQKSQNQSKKDKE